MDQQQHFPTPQRATARPGAAGVRRRRRGAFVAAIGATVALVAGACGSDSLGDQVSQSSGDRPELVLEAALSPGEDPFTESVSDLTEADVAATAEVDHDEVELPGEDDSSAAGTDPSGSLAAVPGDSPGLYGGTGAEGTCDPAAISAHLGADPAKAEAWADAQGIGVHGIDPFLDTLTPMVLLHDTRVTNHGYRNGTATPFQAVLQAGTAVLVDPHGVPRVRCACGNPLAEPDTSHRYEPVGTAWPGYDNSPVVTVTTNVVVNVFVVVNIYTGDTYEVPAGSDVSVEPPVTAPPVQSTTTTTTSTTVPDEGQVPDYDATTCLSRHAELIVLLTPLGLDPLDAAQWMDQHSEALSLIEEGDYVAASSVICELVEEMEVAYAELSGGG